MDNFSIKFPSFFFTDFVWMYSEYMTKNFAYEKLKKKLIPDLGNSGLLHKMDDFMGAAHFAVSINRTLVDYRPGFNAVHMRDKNNRPVKQSNANPDWPFSFVHGWTWSHIADVSQMVYTLKFANVSYKWLNN